MSLSNPKGLLLCFAVSAASLLAQAGSTPTCALTSVVPTVHAEGVAEKMGDVVLDCTGTPGLQVTGNLAVFLNTAVTNKQLSNGYLDVALTVNGALANVQGALNTSNQIVFSGLSFAFPQNGAISLRIQNIRADASYNGTIPPSVGGSGLPGLPIRAQVSFSPAGLLSYTGGSVSIGVPQRGLLTTSLRTLIPSQVGSPLPEN